MNDRAIEVLRAFVRRFPIEGRRLGRIRLCEVCRGSAPVPLDPHIPGCPLAASLAITGMRPGDKMTERPLACVVCHNTIHCGAHRKFNGRGWLHKDCAALIASD